MRATSSRRLSLALDANRTWTEIEMQPPRAVRMEDVLSLRKMEGKGETQGIMTARETVRQWRRQRGKEEMLGEGKQHARGTREARRFLRSDLAGLLFDQIQINEGGKRDSKLRPTPLSETRPRRRIVLPEATALGDGTSLWDSHYSVAEVDFRSQPFEDNRGDRTAARRIRKSFKSANVRIESANGPHSTANASDSHEKGLHRQTINTAHGHICLMPPVVSDEHFFKFID
ncbi:hypothetical protein ACLOJK_000188 [Asimina triloba]